MQSRYFKYKLQLTWLTFLFLYCNILSAQGGEKTWDNLLFAGNKVSWGKERWKTTAELQFRLKENVEVLDQWFIEGLASYLQSKHWEFILPIRYAFKPGDNEFRPGIGALYKSYTNSKTQLTQQVLYQADISSTEVQHGLRYVFFYNYKMSDRLIPNAVAGAFYRWSNEFNGIQFLRAGAGLTYIIDSKHTLNFSYFLGMTNTGAVWNYQGIPFFQLVINLGTNYQHLPAKFINF